MSKTNAGAKFFIAVDVGGDAELHNTDLTEAEFDALTWLEVSNVGNMGETGSNTNIVSYNTLATKVTQKGKGVTDAGSPTVECARNGSDPGQIQMRAAAQTQHSYAFKYELDDSLGVNGTTFYNRGIVTGPTTPNGGNEDFVLAVFTLGLNQEQIEKEAA